MKTTWTVLSAVLGAGAALSLSACASDGDGSAIGFNEITRAQSDTLTSACEQFYGEPKQVASRLGLSLELEYAPDGSANGTCEYTSQYDDTIDLVVSEKKPEGDLVRAKGEKYYVALYTRDSSGNDWPGIENVDKAKKWLESRAKAVTEDYDTWLASLDPADGEFAARGDQFRTEEAGESGALTTPGSTVTVLPLGTADYVVVDGTYLRPADGQRFVFADLTVVDDARSTNELAYELRVDGQPAGDAAQEVLAGATADGATASLCISVPKGAADVSLVAAIGGAAQAISLLTAEIEDDGRSELLQKDFAGGADAELMFPREVEADGETSGWSNGSWSRAYSTSAAIAAQAFSSVAQEWAPEGQRFLGLTLDPDSPEDSAALTLADATVTINGQAYPALTWDPELSLFRFLIPSDPARVQIELKVTPDVSRLSNAWGTVDYTLDGPVTYEWIVDPSQLRADTTDEDEPLTS
ncbi:hypothetical protein HP550_19680 [Cellulomonas humilata]|uniref:Lipoprotein n=1 Tax=Cellulomonas humilata TaxID=144055 RepID=A0A7Y6A4H6_9CELL|nr:hypothetical protein [Cellulomonas humilata]NUU19475.1 hypothetical protein [Cellulomonas humilata]